MPDVADLFAQTPKKQLAGHPKSMDDILSFEDLNEQELGRLAHVLAPFLKAGDFLGLSGALGAGKSVFARALIRTAMGDDTLDVPSPTYNLVLPYQPHGSFPEILHVDLYRIENQNEIVELGLEDASASILLVEWPERLGNNMPGDALHIYIDGGTKSTLRRVKFLGNEGWSKRLENLKLIRT